MTVLGGHSVGDEILGRYRLDRHIASGGMGVVWEAHDRDLDQTVALKHVGFSALPDSEAVASRQRTLREARLAAQLRGHPHVVSIYDVQQVDGDVWLVLEYVPSRSLAELTADGATLGTGEAARIGAAVADALAAAHERGIIHRDVKPGNVLLGTDGSQVKLTDFGIAHAEGENPLTRTNVVSGTPAYMSREVARGDDETAASDVFSLGATLYKAVEGRPPFGEEANSLRMLQRVAHGQVDPPQRAGALGPLLMHLLELDPHTRPDARHAQQMLDDYAHQLREPTHPPSVTTAVPSPWMTGPGTATAAPHPSDGTIAPNPFTGMDSPGPGIGTIAPPPPRPGRTRRRLLIALAAVVAVMVFVGAGAYAYATYVAATPADPTAAPGLPESVPALAITGDPVDADPCALLDPAVMQRLGQVRMATGASIGECRLVIAGKDKSSTYVDVRFSSSAVEDVSPFPVARDLGNAKILDGPAEAQQCVAYVELSDQTLVVVDSGLLVETPVPALCEIRDLAVSVALDTLVRDGVTYRPGWQAQVSLFGKNACQVSGSAVAAVPGVDLTMRLGMPNGSFCYIGSPDAGPYVTVQLGLEPSGQMSSYYGTPSTVAGKTVHTSAQPQVRITRLANSCLVYVVHKANLDGGITGPTEFVAVRIEGAPPPADLCRQATQVALATEKATG